MDWATRARIDRRHRFLGSLIATHGERFHKTHGHWVKLALTPDVCLTMDTWNGAIDLRREPAPYRDWVNGFGRKGVLEYFGMPEPDYYAKVTEKRLEAIIRATELVIKKEDGS